jgi:putative ABC transport system permease protein
MGSLLQDFRYGLRSLAKNPSSTIIAVLALALGIGTTTESFTIVNAALIKPLPFRDSGRLVVIWEKTQSQEREYVTVADFLDWRRMTRSFDSIAASRDWPANLTQYGEPENVRGYQVSANFFQTLGVEARFGRTFRADEDQPGKEHVVILSNKFWRSSYGGKQDIINKEIVLNNEKYTVIGVMPEDVRYPRGSVQVWAPMALDPVQAADRKDNSLVVTARIKSGVSSQQAGADMAAVAERIAEENKETNAGRQAWLLPLREMILGPATQDILTGLVAAFLVLMIACANVASMLLARAASRQKEVAIRIAIGASRFRLVRQFLTEGFVLALVGAGMGLLFAYAGLKLLVSNIPSFISDVNPRMLDVKLDIDAAVFTLGLSFIAVLVFGLAPSLLASRTDVNSKLKDEARGSGGGASRQRVRGILVVTEVALAVVLLIGAGLLFRSYTKVLSVSPGFDTRDILTMDIPLTKSGYPDGRRVEAFYQELLKKIKDGVPGVESVGAISDLPLAGGDDLQALSVDGQPAPPPGQENYVHYRVVSPNYFQAQGLAVIRGNDFGEQAFENKPPVVVVSDSVAAKFWRGGEALGQKLTLQGESFPRQVIGIVRDVKDWDLLNKSKDYAYIPYVLDKPEYYMTLVVRGNSDPASLTSAVRAKISDIDPNQPVTNVKTMDKVLADTRSPQRINMVALMILASISTILAAIGIYGLISYSVAQRTQEIGIRMALGARPMDILKLVSKQGLTLDLIGLGMGLVGSMVLTKGMSSLIYDMNLIDPLTYLSVPILMLTIAMFATYLPARRASKVEPMVALRYE